MATSLEKIIDYVINTPGNTVPEILREQIIQYAGGEVIPKWGDIVGSISNQTDLKTILDQLQTAVDGKQEQLTQDQLNAINSGITQLRVQYLDDIRTGSDTVLCAVNANNANTATKAQNADLSIDENELTGDTISIGNGTSVTIAHAAYARNAANASNAGDAQYAVTAQNFDSSNGSIKESFYQIWDEVNGKVDNTEALIDDTLRIGNNLIAPIYGNALLIGKYNGPLDIDDRIVVSNGTAHSASNNKFVVKEDGTVKLSKLTDGTNSVTIQDILDTQNKYLNKENPVGSGYVNIGNQNTVSGYCAQAFGLRNTASGPESSAEGTLTGAEGLASHAEGWSTKSSSSASHSEGRETVACGNFAHAEGYKTNAYGESSHASGKNTGAFGMRSVAHGYATLASGNNSHAEGNGAFITIPQSEIKITISDSGGGKSVKFDRISGSTVFSQLSSCTGAFFTLSSEPDTTQFLCVTGLQAYGETSVTYKGVITGTQITSGDLASDVTFIKLNAKGESSHAEGYCTRAMEECSHAEGSLTTTWKPHSHAEGSGTQTYGQYAHSEGVGTQAIGDCAHSEGANTYASGYCSHSEGSLAKTNGNYSHAEGYNTLTDGHYSHAEGYETTAAGFGSHAEGLASKANGYYSHASGQNTTASGSYSSTFGSNTIAIAEAQMVAGKYNVDSSDAAFIIGGGISDSDRLNILQLDWDGNLSLGGYVNNLKIKGGIVEDTCSVVGTGGVAVGSQTQVSHNYSFAGGYKSKAYSLNSFAYGNMTNAGPSDHSAGNNFSVGQENNATGQNAISSGYKTEASGSHSFSSGRETSALSQCSFAQGYGGIANNAQTAVFGYYGTASGENSMAVGKQCKAIGANSFAGGDGSQSNTNNTFAFGDHIVTNTNGQVGFGKYNAISEANGNNLLLSIGNGNSEQERSNAFSVDIDGTATFSAIAHNGESMKVENLIDRVNNQLTLEDVYPVGSIYMTMGDSNVPKVFPGKWSLRNTEILQKSKLFGLVQKKVSINFYERIK